MLDALEFRLGVTSGTHLDSLFRERSEFIRVPWFKGKFSVPMSDPARPEAIPTMPLIGFYLNAIWSVELNHVGM